MSKELHFNDNIKKSLLSNNFFNLKTHLKEIYQDPYSNEKFIIKDVDKNETTDTEELSSSEYTINQETKETNFQVSKENYYESLNNKFEFLFNTKVDIILRIPYIVELLGDKITNMFSSKIITTLNEDVVLLASKCSKANSSSDKKENISDKKENNDNLSSSYFNIEIFELPKIGLKLSYKDILHYSDDEFNSKDINEENINKEMIDNNNKSNENNDLKKALLNQPYIKFLIKAIKDSLKACNIAFYDELPSLNMMISLNSLKHNHFQTLLNVYSISFLFILVLLYEDHNKSEEEVERHVKKTVMNKMDNKNSNINDDSNNKENSNCYNSIINKLTSNINNNTTNTFSTNINNGSNSISDRYNKLFTRISISKALELLELSINSNNFPLYHRQFKSFYYNNNSSVFLPYLLSQFYLNNKEIAVYDGKTHTFNAYSINNKNNTNTSNYSCLLIDSFSNDPPEFYKELNYWNKRATESRFALAIILKKLDLNNSSSANNTNNKNIAEACKSLEGFLKYCGGVDFSSITRLINEYLNKEFYYTNDIELLIGRGLMNLLIEDLELGENILISNSKILNSNSSSKNHYYLGSKENSSFKLKQRLEFLVNEYERISVISKLIESKESDNKKNINILELIFSSTKSSCLELKDLYESFNQEMKELLNKIEGYGIHSQHTTVSIYEEGWSGGFAIIGKNKELSIIETFLSHELKNRFEKLSGFSHSSSGYSSVFNQKNFDMLSKLSKNNYSELNNNTVWLTDDIERYCLLTKIGSCVSFLDPKYENFVYDVKNVASELMGSVVNGSDEKAVIYNEKKK